MQSKKSSETPMLPSRHMLARAHIPSNLSNQSAMEAYRAYRDRVRQPFLQRYAVLGFLSSGTYGRVYSARVRKQHEEGGSCADGRDKKTTSASSRTASEDPQEDPLTMVARAEETGEEMYAIKKFKPDKETEQPTYTGISQSAMREIALNRELRHENIVRLREVMLEDKAIYMVFSYADHDFLQLIHHHSTVLRVPIPLSVLKSLLYQLLQGVAYLHANWVLHRDLKPANILVTSHGQVKIGDLGLARVYSAPLLPLYNADKVVVTIWYRAPELLLGARHYTPAIDLWAVGCIWGELLALRPMFKGEEAKMDPKTKAVPFQTDQLTRIVEILGTPTPERWPGIGTMPDYKTWWPHLGLDNYADRLQPWYTSRSRPQTGNPAGFDLFECLLTYDPAKRLTAEEVLHHPWWKESPTPTLNAFAELPSLGYTYPSRRMLPLNTDGADASMALRVPPHAKAQEQASKRPPSIPQNLIDHAMGRNLTAQQASAAALMLVAAKQQAQQQQQQQQKQAAPTQQAPQPPSASTMEHSSGGAGRSGIVENAMANDPSMILASAVAMELAAGVRDTGARDASASQRAAAQDLVASSQLTAQLQATTGTASLGLLNAIPQGPSAPPPAPISAAPSVGSSGPPAGASDGGAGGSVGGGRGTSSAGNGSAAGLWKGPSSNDMRSTATSNASMQRNKRQKIN